MFGDAHREGHPGATAVELDGAESLLHGRAEPGDRAGKNDPPAPQQGSDVQELHDVTGRTRRYTLIAVVGILAATALDATVVSVALPTIRQDLGSSVAGIQWVSSVYMLALALVLVPAGRLTDSLGAARMLRIGLICYIAASALAAAAPDTVVLILGRAGQGLAAGLVGPATVVLIESAYGAARRGRAFGLITMLLAIASASGPVVGGFLTDTIGWRTIFVLHAGMAVISLALSGRTVRPAGHGGRALTDPVALLALAAVILGLQLSIIEGGQRGAMWGVACIVLAVLAALVLWRRDRNSPDPLVDLSLLRIPPVLATVLCRVAVSFAFYGNIFYLTLFLQGPAGYSAVQTGLILLPASLVGIAAAPLAGRLVDRLGANPMMIVGTVAAALSLLVMALVHETSSVPLHIAPGLALNGFGYSLTTISTKVAPLASVTEDMRGRVTALVSVTSRMAAGFGVTFATGVFNLLLGPSIGRAVRLLLDAEPTVQLRNYVRSEIGSSDLATTITDAAARNAGFASADQAAATIDKSFALAYSLLSGIVGVLVLLVALGMTLLVRRHRGADDSAAGTPPA